MSSFFSTPARSTRGIEEDRQERCNHNKKREKTGSLAVSPRFIIRIKPNHLFLLSPKVSSQSSSWLVSMLGDQYLQPHYLRSRHGPHLLAAFPLVHFQQLPRLPVDQYIFSITPTPTSKHPPDERGALVVPPVKVQLLHRVQQLLRLVLGDLLIGSEGQLWCHGFPNLFPPPPFC